MNSNHQQLLNDCVIALRTGQQGAASYKLEELIKQIESQLQEHPDLLNKQLAQLLASAFACLGRNDFIGLADILEFEISPILPSSDNDPEL
ncbi:hypothetical protein [Solemya velesiana gill symbiont]|uniref:Uncharacterized protein n=1 Tax=Solemya velesiana gill symbiont TaxID=1918948 RepID=A0A1T2KUB1_9GAMM|nr:hypothetical protein [Solemya velesiana gill symbiont]OOZ36447.1 hypothetical protein BOW51_07185 [Solemya velesiana gill symbiont]